MKKIKTLIIFGLSLLTFTVNVQAEDGILAGSFLRMGLGARANAMGNAFTAIADGPVAAYYNPAGIPMLESRHVDLSYRFLSLDRNFNYIGFATGVRPKIEQGSEEIALKGGVALSWIHSGVDNIDGRDLAGNHSQNFSNSEDAFALSFGVMPLSNLSIGFTAKVLFNRFPKMSDDESTLSNKALGLDLGILYKPLPFLSIGFAIKELNARYDWKTDKLFEKDIDKIDRFPRTYRGGIAVNWPYPWLLVAMDIEKNKHQDMKVFVGTEAILKYNCVVRAGVNNGSLTFGGGYNFELFSKPVQIQYAFVTHDYDIAAEHIFSWAFQL